MYVKQGDIMPVTFTVNHDLTGATVRLIARHLTRDGQLEELDATVTDPTAGVLVHNLDGTWATGRHFLELEISQDGEVRTAPTEGTYEIRVIPDLD